MKKLLSIIIVLLFISCAKETPFEKSISEYVKTTFKDPSSYEKISIEVLDTVTVAKKIATYKSRGVSHEEFDNEPKDKFLYYTVSHKYRANNSFGAKILCDDIVSMNKDYKITGSHGVDE
jgi:PBP1b-binding outer membrane lipoprotein LpoB